MLDGFKKFILRGNVVDMAVGVVIGAAFGGVVNSLTTGLLTPFIGALVKLPDFSNLKYKVRGSDFLIGNVLNAVISFLLIAAAVYFFVVLPVNWLMARMVKGKPAPAPTTRRCPECLSEIPMAARRCAHCAQVVMASVVEERVSG
jgi:large conductance mechanosensitive channel